MSQRRLETRKNVAEDIHVICWVSLEALNRRGPKWKCILVDTKRVREIKKQREMKKINTFLEKKKKKQALDYLT